jgi:hypothetical protein
MWEVIILMDVSSTGPDGVIIPGMALTITLDPGPGVCVFTITPGMAGVLASLFQTVPFVSPSASVVGEDVIIRDGGVQAVTDLIHAPICGVGIPESILTATSTSTREIST